MKYTIISTYPAEGSQNIGDKLITTSTISAIKSIKGEECIIEVVWKRADWDEVKNTVLDSDAIIFACLAIRNNIEREYPYIKNILDSKIPIGVMAAGTSLEMNNQSQSLFETDIQTIEILKRLNEESLFFTSRGVLTQMFCNYHGLDKTIFSGDIAFFDQRFKDRKFSVQENISEIAISDPHYAKFNLKSLDLLIAQLRKAFPDANISCVLHGKNRVVENYCEVNKIHLIKIFEKPNNGLDVYDEFDLHVGYRVHAHVSTLLRRNISYLLEQDGRGADYGLSINRKCTVENFFTNKFDPSVKNIIKKIIGRSSVADKRINLDPVFRIVSMIRKDKSQSFDKFLKLEDEILEFNLRCISALKKLP